MDFIRATIFWNIGKIFCSKIEALNFYRPVLLKLFSSYNNINNPKMFSTKTQKKKSGRTKRFDMFFFKSSQNWKKKRVLIHNAALLLSRKLKKSTFIFWLKKTMKIILSTQKQKQKLSNHMFA